MRRGRFAVTLTLWLVVAGCAGVKTPKVEGPKLAGEGKPAACAEANARIDALTKEQAELRAEHDEQKSRVAVLELQVLERDAHLKALRGQLASQQSEFDQAIGEVVRSKAKLRSLESKAEAASDMAEAEIALSTVRARRPAGEAPSALPQAVQLLKMAAQEFEKGNYGGSLYLTSQARTKIHVVEVQTRLRERLDPVPGEVRFAAPVELKVAKASNIRKAPSLESEVLATLPPGTALTGYSYKGGWVRVESRGRATGWVFQELLLGLE
jgi:hypothetical protein